ncbi:PAS domain S-box protein [Lunatimonas salinarum]|uniref:PAS domain S-box protein n=1 Tax=Lunatimonas salinarum TaxID=1774590 RepID=UPI001AE03E9F|nr:PAS domain S-box protein [Lunatimonas salinarum]
MNSERILKAIGESYQIFSDPRNLKASIQAVIATLGEATEVDRVYIFKNYVGKDGAEFFSYKFEWVAPNVEPQLGLPLLAYVPWDAFENIGEQLLENKVINGRVEENENEHFKETMRVQGILAFLFIPVFCGDNFWGFIGFDNCKSDELFSEQQKTALHALGATLGAIIENKRQRRRIQREKLRYKNIIDHVGEVLFILDDKFRIKFLSKAWITMTGISMQRAIGKNIEDFIKPSFREKFWEFVAKRTKSTSQEHQIEVKILTSQGSFKWVKASVIQAQQAYGAKRYFGFILDIDREKESELIRNEISARYETVLKNVSDTIYALDINGSSVFISENIENFGFGPEEYLKEGFLSSMVHIEDQAQLFAQFKKLPDLKSVNASYRICNKAGEIFWVNDLRWIEYSELDGEQKIYGRISDITDLKEKEAEVKKTSKDLLKVNELLQTVNEIQVSFLFDEDFRKPLDALLVKILTLTGSRFGFMGEVFYGDDGKPYLKSHTITNISWSEETEAFYQKNFKVGIEFRNLDTLFGYCLVNRVPVISNNPSQDPRSGGLPQGHPPLLAFLGLPISKNGELIGMIGLANSQDGYSEKDVEFLRPISNSYANFIQTIRLSRQRRLAEEERERTNQLFQMLSESANDIIAFHDPDGTFRYVSPSLYRILGYLPEEAIGKTPDEAFGKSEQRSFSRNSSNVIIAKYPHKISRKTVYLEIIINYLSKDDEPSGTYLAVSRDVTERELMLQRLVSSYEKEKELNMLKSRFISMTSHELRTPLSTILSSNQLLKSYLAKINDKELAAKSLGHVDKITRQVKRLSGVIEDILILEKNAAGSLKVTLSPVPIKAFLDEMCDTFCAEMPAMRKQRKFFPEAEKIVYTDENLLRHVVSNLIENAVKYGRPDGEGLELHLTYHAQDFEITVKDQGIGIPKEDQKHIFDSFYRAKNAELIQGTGLGLHIVSEFTMRLGGKISFESKENKGTTFKLKIPNGSKDSVSGG